MKDDRLAAIREHLYSQGYSSIQDLADAVGASVATIRRDLLRLEADGAVTRTHGGAHIAEPAEVEVAFQVREQHNLTAKRAIASTAFDDIAPHSSLFLDAGTTVLQVARLLRLDPIPLSVFTNCINVAHVLIDVPEIKVTLLGGRLRQENASVVGALAEEVLNHLWFDQVFLGCDAVAEDDGFYCMDEDEARLNGKMLERTTTASLLVDSSKFGLRQTYRVAALSRDIMVVTDDGLSPAWRRRLKDALIPLTLALTGTVAPGIIPANGNTANARS